MNERETIEFLNDMFGLGLSLCEDSFQTYDAHSDSCLVEVKNRRAYYFTKLIEARKLFVNFQKAQIQGKSFLYVVTDERGVYVFNVTKHIDKITSFKLSAKKHPVTTDFGDSRRIVKYCYELPEDLSIYIPNETKQNE